MTVKYLLDEHIHVAIASGLWQKLPDLQIAETRLLFPGLSDPELLEWATVQGYILLSSDRNTLIEFYNERLRAGLHSEGVFILRQGISFGEMIDELSVIALASEATEWANQVNFIPFRNPG
jgi:Domain of unknown function (DUF5615)